jgi:hypothetical protein
LHGHQPHPLARLLPPPPPEPCACGPAALAQPAPDMQRRPWARVVWEGRGRQAHDYLRVLLYRPCPTPALALALIGPPHLPRLPWIAIEACAAGAVRPLDLAQPPREAIVGARPPPSVPWAARLAPATRLPQEEPAERARDGAEGRRRHREEGAEPPPQPIMAGAQTLAPGRRREVGAPEQDGPGPQGAYRQGPQDIGQHAAPESIGGRQSAPPLTGLASTGLLGKGGGEPRPHLRRPGGS